MKDIYIASLAMAGALLFGAVRADAAEHLADATLDAITAGEADVESDKLLTFTAQHQTASGRDVRVDGSIDLDRLRSIDAASLMLKDNAQSNLQSLININAVQSSVNVLVNLNIMIDSHVGELKQLNLGPR